MHMMLGWGVALRAYSLFWRLPPAPLDVVGFGPSHLRRVSDVSTITK